MKAAQINEYGDVSKVQIVDIPQPTAQEGQALVEVYASSLNPFDTTVRAGYMKDAIPLQLPVTLGGDIAGVVTGLGQGVTNLSVGDKVYGQANVAAGNSGAFAELAATNTGQIAAMPSNLDFAQAASLPLVGVSALQALTEHIKLQAGQKIFIHGGAGGIGSIAIQIAKYLGAIVATTANGEAVEYVKQLGADEVVDYKSEDFSKVLTEYDAVFDTVGGEDFVKAYGILKQGGIAVSMIAAPDESKASAAGITAFMQSTHVTTEALQALTQLIEQNIVQPHIGQVFSLEHIQDAFTARETGSVKGKVVIQIKS